MVGMNRQRSFGQGKDCQPAFSFEFTILEDSQENIAYIGSNATKIKALGNTLGLLKPNVHLFRTSDGRVCIKHDLIPTRWCI
jgi:hypothetical protein